MNPCPCGYHGHPTRACHCTTTQVLQYQARLSGPLRDRIDLAVDVAPVPIDVLTAGAGESSALVRARVLGARRRQLSRGPALNARIPAAILTRAAPLDAPGSLALRAATERLHLSPRGVHRLLRVARTIADLDAAEAVGADHVSEAAQYRHTFGTAGCR
jgi:magnesium chelatase family protein